MPICLAFSHSCCCSRDPDFDVLQVTAARTESAPQILKDPCVVNFLFSHHDMLFCILLEPLSACVRAPLCPLWSLSRSFWSGVGACDVRFERAGCLESFTTAVTSPHVIRGWNKIGAREDWTMIPEVLDGVFGSHPCRISDRAGSHVSWFR